MEGHAVAENQDIRSVLQEDRIFEPPAEFDSRIGGALVGSMEQYRSMHERSLEDPEGFWGEIASEFHWFKPWEKVVEWSAPDCRWFDGGTTHQWIHYRQCRLFGPTQISKETQIEERKRLGLRCSPQQQNIEG